MKILNFINPNEGLKYRVDKFPDSELSLVITDTIERKETYRVVTRITCADDLYILLQVGDILDRHGVVWDLQINYLMSMRMDRVLDFNRPFSLRVIGSMISSMGYRTCLIFTPHSERSIIEIRDSKAVQYMYDINTFDMSLAIVFPDAGCFDRCMHMFDFTYCSSIVFDKTRDLNTGVITSFEIHDERSKIIPNWKTKITKFIFIDDLCDAGGTFLGELSALKELIGDTSEKSFDIMVPHIVNPVGYKNLQNNFNTVYTTDSYKNWESQDTVIVRPVGILE